MNFHYRSFKEEDIDRCAELALEAWPLIVNIAEDPCSLMKAYIKIGISLSNYTEVCCNGDQVIAFLFGFIKGKGISLQKRKMAVNLFWEFISGKYGQIKKKFRFLGCFMLTILKVELLCHKFDSEVELIVVDKEYRGKGLGRRLIDRFIEKAYNEGAKTVYLYTDIESNWRFYEAYGFTKFKEFYDNGLSFLKREKIKSYIYVLKSPQN